MNYKYQYEEGDAHNPLYQYLPSTGRIHQKKWGSPIVSPTVWTDVNSVLARNGCIRYPGKALSNVSESYGKTSAVARFFRANTGRNASTSKDVNNRSSSVFNELSKIIDSIVREPETVNFDITGNTNWPSGTFRSEGSCWWSSDSYRKHFARGAGYGPGLALRFYFSGDEAEQRPSSLIKNGLSPRGRCFIVGVYDGILVMNSYDTWQTDKNRKFTSGANDNSRMAEFLAEAMVDNGAPPLSTMRVDVDNNNHGLHINGWQGVLIYPSGSSPSHEYDMDWEDISTDYISRGSFQDCDYVRVMGGLYPRDICTKIDSEAPRYNQYTFKATAIRSKGGVRCALRDWGLMSQTARKALIVRITASVTKNTTTQARRKAARDILGSVFCSYSSLSQPSNLMNGWANASPRTRSTDGFIREFNTILNDAW